MEIDKEPQRKSKQITLLTLTGLKISLAAIELREGLQQAINLLI